MRLQAVSHAGGRTLDYKRLEGVDDLLQQACEDQVYAIAHAA